MANTEFRKALKHVLKQERGFSNHQSDHGGATNYGITLNRYAEYKGDNVTIDQLKSIKPNEVEDIYQEYWDSVSGDEIQDKRISLVLFDQMVNKGDRAKKHMQKLLGVTQDGSIGPQTINAINSLTPEQRTDLVDRYLDNEYNDYNAIVKRDPSQQVFLNGWHKRLDNLSNAVGVSPSELSITKRGADNDIDPGHKSYFQSGFLGLIEDPETLENASIIANGQFRINDIILNIPPESISILINEYEDSIHLMRQETPVNKQSGRKRIRILVNFPVDISNGYDELSRMIIQIKKTPIATIENEKIRKELYGDVYDYTNIGVVVDNLSGYVEEDYPNLIRCTLQMSWFNHVPYVDEIKYVEIKNGKKVYQKAPSSQFQKFYLNNTSNNNNVLINNPVNLLEKDSLVIMYKEYQRFSGTTTISRPNSKSKLDSTIKSMDHSNFLEIQRLKKEGWYVAEENQDRWDDLIDGVFYRWRRFEIPFNDLDTSGALLLQNVSFSLSTNPSYINMEMYSVPTIQFLGGSTADLRAICFAAAEYASEDNKLPVMSSSKLGELQTIFKKISQDRITYSKYAKENHLLISHPLAKLLKFRSNTNNPLDFHFIGEDGLKHNFRIDDYLPVIVSNTQSSTITGLPFASKLQIDFRETRLARRDNPIKFIESAGSAKGRNVQEKILNTLFTKNLINYNPRKAQFEESVVVDNKGTPEYSRGIELKNALNQLLIADPKATSIKAAFESPFFNSKDIALTIRNARSRDSFAFERQNRLDTITDAFNLFWVSDFLLAFYVDFCNGVYKGEKWVEAYIDDFDGYGNIQPKGNKDLYPDMLLPDGENNPAFYFSDNVNRMENYRKTIMAHMPTVYSNMSNNIKSKLLNPNFIKEELKDESFIAGVTAYPPASNFATYEDSRQTGVARIHDIGKPDYRIMATQQALANATAPIHSLQQVYPTFQIQLFNEKYTFFQKFSSEDVRTQDLFEKNQKDLLDIFDLSSIIDIRIIKDEYEAADVMIIRVLSTHKTLMTNQAKDPSYNPDTFSTMQLIKDIIEGNSNIGSTYNSNLEDIGLKEGVKIRALLGNSNDNRDLNIEFTGRIAAINGKDVVEIYCIGDGHELIQNILGYTDGDSTKEFTFNSDTTNLIAKILASAEEVKSFGNTTQELIRGIGFNTPMLMGGRSALDNIYAPSIHPTGSDLAQFGTGAFDTALTTITSIGGVAIPLAIFGGIAATTLIPIGIIGAVAAGALGVVTEAYSYITKKLFPAPFTVFQQTIWDVLQELTLRHPGYVCAVVPFDNRSSIYFGEPDGIFFYRGAETAMEKALRIKTGDDTLRERYDQRSEFNDLKLISEIGDPTSPFSKVDAKTRIETRNDQIKKSLGSADIEMLALLSMQKSFRDYHLVTSEHDIISNDIEASSLGVANSVQVYHPSNSDDVNFDGTQYIEDYKLTDKMKADDDLHSNLINNKVFTFHNAHENHEGLELPQRYAKAILCKELENIYKGKITILGRKGIKPHDIVILRDTHNKISGPVKVGRVVQTISPATGWITSIYPRFIAIPDTSAGAFQIKAILKASRFWLGDEAELFYSSMEKFIPSEFSGSFKEDEELSKAINAFGGQSSFINEKDILNNEPGKDILEREGEYSLINDTLQSGTLVGGQVLGAKYIAPGLKQAPEQVKNLAILAKESAKQTASLIAKRQITQAGVLGGSSLFNVGVKTAVTGAKIGGGVFGGLLLGFGLDYLIESATDGFINFMKNRQPVSIFPLTKDGRPWMAALNGFKENTPIEHFKLQATRGADKLAMASLLAQKLAGEWFGEQIGVGNSEDVEISGVVDGDTLQAEDGIPSSAVKLLSGTGEVFRLTGVDTGEKTAAPGSAEKFMADEAKKFLENRIKENGGVVTVRRDGKDRYRRTLAGIYVNGQNLGEELVLNKLGFFYKGQPKKTTEDDWKQLKAEYEKR